MWRTPGMSLRKRQVHCNGFNKASRHPRRQAEVLLVGSEIESLVCALTMKKCGTKPTLLKGLWPPATEERATVLSIGTTRVLEKLDVLDRLTKKCSIITSHTRMDHQGNEWGKINFRELAELHGFPHIVIPTATLLKILEDNIEAAEIPTLSHTQLVGLEHVTNKAGVVRVKARTKQVQPVGEGIKEYDLVIGADGPQSEVRNLLWKQSELRTHLLVGRYSAVIQRPPTYPISQIVEMWGPGSVLCSAPMGNDKLIVWGIFKPEAIPTHVPQRTTRSMEEFIKFYDLYSGPWHSLRKELEKSQYVQLDYFADTKVHGRPVYSRVGLIGQAARGIMPILYGHDVQQAVEDAVIIAEAATHNIPIDQVLPSYVSIRETKSNSVQLAATTVMSAVLATRQDWKMKLKYYLLKADNTSTRLMERENKLIGFDVQRLKIRQSF